MTSELSWCIARGAFMPTNERTLALSLLRVLRLAFKWRFINFNLTITPITLSSNAVEETRVWQLWTKFTIPLSHYNAMYVTSHD